MKRFNIMFNVGKIKYLVNYHNGIDKHNDGSDFFNIKTFKNKKKMNCFVKELLHSGYKSNY